jgi:DNA (cytosine-5)-methyltransferase 1
MALLNKLSGLSLFSGIGGIEKALEDWVETVHYCEINPYCVRLLKNKMDSQELYLGKIWEDVRNITIKEIGHVNIITAGFPCQDISVAGNGKGLEGERSGLFFEIMRLAKEIKPEFLFLENVPAITTRGGLKVVKEIASLGYDCRWCVISASAVGALQRRERWFLLAKRNETMDCDPTPVTGLQTHSCTDSELYSKKSRFDTTDEHWPFKSRADWQETVCHVPRSFDGVPDWLDRVQAIGNSVVPAQAKEAFKILCGLK